VFISRQQDISLSDSRRAGLQVLKLMNPGGLSVGERAPGIYPVFHIDLIEHWCSLLL
jgi:hypothetical protein